MFRDYSCLLFADCTGEPLGEDFQRSNHEASLSAIQALLGWVLNSERRSSRLSPGHRLLRLPTKRVLEMGICAQGKEFEG